MSKKDQRRVSVLERLSSGACTTAQASEVLGLSTRQVRRLQVAYAREGMAGVVHGNRSRPAPNKTPSEMRERVLSLVSDPQMLDWSAAHLQEWLQDDHEIVLGRSTLDRWLRQEGLRKAHKKRAAPVRRRRQRQAAEGAMVQCDGSVHFWLEDRAGKFCLMGAIDDATGKVLYLEFRPTEDQIGYLRLVRSLVLTYGIPQSIYAEYLCRVSIMISIRSWSRPKRPPSRTNSREPSP